MDESAVGPRSPRRHSIGEAVSFKEVGLLVQLQADQGLLFLDVRSQLDRSQGLLLPASHRPLIGGVSLFTRLGRLHARYWALAYGAGPAASGASVCFESTSLRHRRTAVTAAHDLAAGFWVAAAEGAFEVAALVVNGNQMAHVPLADRW